jgi:hypothetical protein
MFRSFRPTASRLKRQLGYAAGICVALLGLSAAPALAADVCEDQTFLQPFSLSNDNNYYTLVPGGEFNGPSEGWELSHGAQVVHSTRPDGTTGGVLDLPSGAKAVSPPMCVTLQYPSGRVWVRNVVGAEGVSVDVAYAGTPTALVPKNVGQVHGQQNSWTLSNPFNLQPQTAGPLEFLREVRLVFIAGGQTSDFELWGVYVDPRMR